MSEAPRLNELTATPPVAREAAGREAIPGQLPSPPSIDAPRLHQADLQQIDWGWILRVLTIVRDRAQSGTPLHVTRCPWLAGDPREQMRNGAVRMIDEIFATAVVDEPE
jgi:hypothetical protein